MNSPGSTVTESVRVVLSTAPAGADIALARGVVEAGLAACVNVLPGARSVYRWEGAIQEDGESLLVMKTTQGRIADLEAHVQASHPYDVPEFVVLPVEGGSEAYLGWVREETGVSPGAEPESLPGEATHGA